MSENKTAEDIAKDKAKTIAENVAYYHRSSGKAISEGHKEILSFAKSHHQSKLQAIIEEVGKLRVKVEGGLAPGMKSTTYVDKEKVIEILTREIE